MPAAEEGRLAVNGMSYNRQDGKNANNAIMVTVTPEEFQLWPVLRGPLAGIAFQHARGKSLE